MEHVDSFLRTARAKSILAGVVILPFALAGSALADSGSRIAGKTVFYAMSGPVLSITIDDDKAGMAKGDDFGNASVSALSLASNITDMNNAAQMARFTVRASMDYGVMVTTDVWKGPPFIVLPGLPVRGNSIYAKLSGVTTSTNFMSGLVFLIDPHGGQVGWNLSTGTVAGNGTPGVGQWKLGAVFLPGIAGSDGKHRPGSIAPPDDYRATATVTIAASR